MGSTRDRVIVLVALAVAWAGTRLRTRLSPALP